VDVYPEMAGRNPLAQNALGEKAVEHPRKKREDVDLQWHDGGVFNTADAENTAISENEKPRKEFRGFRRRAFARSHREQAALARLAA
jgi:hypothetical protein